MYKTNTIKTKLPYVPIWHLLTFKLVPYERITLIPALFPSMEVFLELIFWDNKQLFRRIRFDFFDVLKSFFQTGF